MPICIVPCRRIVHAAIRQQQHQQSTRFGFRYNLLQSFSTQQQQSGGISTALDRLIVEPGKLVTGLTRESLTKDPEILEFLVYNYPEAFLEEKSELSELYADDEIEEDEEVYDGNISYPRNIRPLIVYRRDHFTEEGSRSCRRLRKKGKMVPGRIHGGDPTLGILADEQSRILVKTPQSTLEGEYSRYLSSFESRVYDLNLLDNPDDDSGGEIIRVTPQNFNQHPFKDTTFYCVNYCRYHPGKPLSIPFMYTNEDESVALRRDGYIVPIHRKIEVIVEDGVDIPQYIGVDCTNVAVRDVIRYDRVILPDGVTTTKRFMKKKDFIVGVVFGRGRGDPEDDEVTPGSTPAEEKEKK